MKILMLNTPYKPKFSRSSRSPAVAKGGTIYYPLWLSYAAGVLEKEGHEVKIIDAPARKYSHEDVEKITKEFGPGLIVAETSTGTIIDDVKFVAKIKKISNSAFAVLVGTHPSAMPKETLKLDRNIDAVARHEYDYIIMDLAKELEKKKPNLKRVKGITYREKNKIISNKDMPLIENLDELPFVSEIYKTFQAHWQYYLCYRHRQRQFHIPQDSQA